MERYKLVGIINLYNVCPDFVFPVFQCFEDNKLYFQNGKIDIIQNFDYIGEKLEDKVVYFTNIQNDVVILCENEVDIDEMPVLAFQNENRDILCANAEDMIDFLKDYHTDNDVLQKIINGYINDYNWANLKRKKKDKTHNDMLELYNNVSYSNLKKLSNYITYNNPIAISQAQSNFKSSLLRTELTPMAILEENIIKIIILNNYFEAVISSRKSKGRIYDVCVKCSEAIYRNDRNTLRELIKENVNTLKSREDAPIEILDEISSM